MKYTKKDTRKLFTLRYYIKENGTSRGTVKEFTSKPELERFITENNINIVDILDCKVNESYFLKIKS